MFRSQPISRVLYLLRGDDHLSRTDVTDSLMRPYPGTERAAPLFPYLILLQVGFTWPASYLTAGELLPRLSTLTAKCGGISLLHFPWGHPHRELPGTLPVGARTFLRELPFGTCLRDHPVDFVTILLDYFVLVK